MGVFNVKPKQGSNYELPPAGSHAANCVALIDLGTHIEKYGNKPPYDSRKVFIVWELCEERSQGGEPFYLGRKYTLSIHADSHLGKLIGSWRGKSLAADEDFDLTKLLGKSCILNVTHEESKTTQKPYAAVSMAMPLPKGMKAAKPEVTPIVWDFESGKPAPADAWIPWVHGQKLQDVLNEAKESRRQPATVSATVNMDADDPADDYEIL